MDCGAELKREVQLRTMRGIQTGRDDVTGRKMVGFAFGNDNY